MSHTDSLPVSAQALAKAIDCAGSQSALARLLGVSQNAVSLWLRNAKPLPAEHVLTVERETGVSRHALRPDLYPPEDAVPPSNRIGASR